MYMYIRKLQYYGLTLLRLGSGGFLFHLGYPTVVQILLLLLLLVMISIIVILVMLIITIISAALDKVCDVRQRKRDAM